MKQIVYMEERFTRKDFWDGAGKAGIVLGLVSIAYMLITELLLQPATGKIGALPLSVISFFVWAGKFGGCIVLMRFFMQRFAGRFSPVTRRDVFRYGMAIALTSALIYSAFYLAWAKFIDPEMFAHTFEAAAEQYSSMMDSNTLEMLEQMQDKMPVIAFFTNLIYCFLFGTILSSIFAGRIVREDDPFADNQNPFSNDNQ